MKTQNVSFIIMLVMLSVGINAWAQKETVAVLNIDVDKKHTLDAVSMGNLVRLEVEKTNVYNVLDKYDLAYITRENKFDVSECFGSLCLTDAGKLLGADKMITGSVERFDDKIIIILRLIDVESGKIAKTDIMEYLDLPEIQNMVQVSVNNLLGIENDVNTVNMITSYDEPINTPKTQLRLTGPRIGFSYIGGEYGNILTAPEKEGGFDARPFNMLIGYQYEKSYLSSGNFQALIEFIGFLGGLDQNRFVPSVTIMNGFRSNRSGWEFAFGPSFEIMKMADGFYDPNNGNNWTLVEDGISTYGEYENIPAKIESRMDSRGSANIVTSWVWAFGKTFKSGYLNIPVNIFASHKSNGWVVGTSFGFNVSKYKK